MRKLARFSFRHRRLVLAGWLVALVGITLLTRAVGTGYSNSFTLPKTESTKAIELLQVAQPRQAGDQDQIVLATSGGAKVTDPDVQAKVTAMLAKVAALAHVTNVRSPYSPPRRQPDQRRRNRRFRGRHIRRAGAEPPHRRRQVPRKDRNVR